MTRDEAIEKVKVVLARLTDEHGAANAPAFVVDALVALGLLKVEDRRH